jgi:AcrR family transcriptional regulator
MSTRDARAEETRRTLLRVARELFTTRGYAAVGTEEIVQTAGVTRGALYHHFRDKQQLFRAVHEELEAEIVASTGAAVADMADVADMIDYGIRAFLDLCTDPRIARVTLIDAPTVLGWRVWREIDEQYGLGLVEATLAAAMDAGVLARQDVRTLAHLLLGALGEAALMIANDPDPVAARARVEPALAALLGNLRPT